MTREKATAFAATVACFALVPLEYAPFVALASAVAVMRWMPRLKMAADVEASHQLRIALPIAIDVMSLALDAGVPWDRAAGIAADCVNGSLAQDLHLASSRLAMGASADEVWRGSPTLELIGEAVERSFRSGAAVTELLRQLADSQRASERLRRIENVRRLETKILMPVTFLGMPAFVVLGVIPTFAAMLQQMDFSWLSTG